MKLVHIWYSEETGYKVPLRCTKCNVECQCTIVKLRYTQIVSMHIVQRAQNNAAQIVVQTATNPCQAVDGALKMREWKMQER